MNLFEGILLNTILVLFPLTAYLLYLVYAKTIDKEESAIWLQLTLFTSFYGIYKYGNNIIPFIPVFFISLSLILAYTKKCSLCALTLSTLLIVYHYNYGYNIILLLLEYSIYLLLYLCIKKQTLFVNLFLAVKVLFLLAWFYYSGSYQNLNHEIIAQLVFVLIIYYIMLQIIIWVFYKSEKIINFHTIAEQLEYEKQLKSSLFKITHEIKNPIAVCKGYLDMLDTKNKEQVTKYIPIIKEEIERTLIIIKDFLAIGHVTIEKDIMDVVMLIEEIINSYDHIFKKNNIICHVNFECEELFVEADYNRLKQVLINVIKNSVEAIKNDGIINITVKENNDNFYIIIDDNGRGMSKQDLEQIKKPFFTTKKNGIGLGVSLSDEIIKAHNGTMTYESQLGKGTTVTIKIKK